VRRSPARTLARLRAHEPRRTSAHPCANRHHHKPLPKTPFILPVTAHIPTLCHPRPHSRRFCAHVAPIRRASRVRVGASYCLWHSILSPTCLEARTALQDGVMAASATASAIAGPQHCLYVWGKTKTSGDNIPTARPFADLNVRPPSSTNARTHRLSIGRSHTTPRRVRTLVTVGW
jgi:hypothetical protein